MNKKWQKPVLLLAAIAMALTIYSCKEKSYGSGLDPDAEVKTVAEIFLNPELRGQNVTIEGRIHAQCPSNGCWFVLQDDTGQIYVDLARNGFEIPPMQGRAIAATGIVSHQRGTMMIFAQGVVLR